MAQRKGQTGKDSRQRSFRFSADTLALLDELAAERGESSNRLAEGLLAEGLRRERHPLIYFRRAASGRRPALVGTRLDVGQVVETARANRGDLAETARILEIPESHVRACVEYYSDFEEEVEALARRDREIARREEDAWRRSEEVLA
jgi:uncharacterized protein (DUF433 family)